MTLSGIRLAVLILVIVTLTLALAFGVASLTLWLFGDWEKHAGALTLTLRIMWGSWLVLLAGTILTPVTAFGWRFRRPQPASWPAALRRAVADGRKAASETKSGAESFTVTVVLVSLLGTAIVATVLIWILGNWERFGGPLGLTLKIIWICFWLLFIATVITRNAIFGRRRKRQREENQ